MLFWYRADQVHLTSGAVDTAIDLSGNGRNATQGTAGQRPAWSATSGPNNTPGMTFTAASHQQLATASFNINSLQMDLFCVVTPNNVDALNGASIAGTGDGSVAGRFNVAAYGGDYYDAVALGAGDMDWESAIQPLNSSVLLECVWDKTIPTPNAFTYISGALSGGPFLSVNDVSTFGNFVMKIGGQFPITGQFSSFPGVIAEIFAYAGLVNAAQRKSLNRGYLSPRYGIPVQ